MSSLLIDRPIDALQGAAVQRSDGGQLFWWQLPQRSISNLSWCTTTKSGTGTGNTRTTAAVVVVAAAAGTTTSTRPFVVQLQIRQAKLRFAVQWR